MDIKTLVVVVLITFIISVGYIIYLLHLRDKKEQQDETIWFDDRKRIRKKPPK